MAKRKPEAKRNSAAVYIRLPTATIEALDKLAKRHGETVHGEIVARIHEIISKESGDPDVRAMRGFIEAVLYEHEFAIYGTDNPNDERRAMATTLKAELIALLDQLGATAHLPDIEREIGERSARRIIERARHAAAKKPAERSAGDAALANAFETWGLQTQKEKGE